MVSEKEDSGLFVLDYLIELSPSLNETEPIITPTGILRWQSQTDLMIAPICSYDHRQKPVVEYTI